MNKHDFLSAMERVLAFYNTPNEQKEPGEFKSYQTWLEVLFDKVKHIDSAKFPAVVDAFLDVRPRFRKDLDHRKMIAVYKDLAEKNGWTKVLEHNCGSCRGGRFVYIWARDKRGVEFKAMLGCGACNTPYSHLHPDFEQIPAPTFEKIDDSLDNVRRMPAFMAEGLMAIADKGNLQPKEEILNALVEALDNVAHVVPIKHNPAVRKNQLVRALIEAPGVKVVDAGTAEEEPAKMDPPTVAAMSTEQPSPATPTEPEPVDPETVLF